jgi:hypothetical protein
MVSNELRRARASEVVPEFDLISAIAVKAEALLGYSALRKRLGIHPASLTRTLEELGIDPFLEDGVRLYKAAKARDLEAKVWADFQRRAGLDPVAAVEALVTSFVRVSWRCTKLAKFKGEIPEFALSRAVEIKERLPKARFYVEELTVEKRYDPFLIVACGRERFYIDVWDEAEFEAQHG